MTASEGLHMICCDVRGTASVDWPWGRSARHRHCESSGIANLTAAEGHRVGRWCPGVATVAQPTPRLTVPRQLTAGARSRSELLDVALGRSPQCMHAMPGAGRRAARIPFRPQIRAFGLSHPWWKAPGPAGQPVLELPLQWLPRFPRSPTSLASACGSPSRSQHPDLASFQLHPSGRPFASPLQDGAKIRSGGATVFTVAALRVGRAQSGRIVRVSPPRFPGIPTPSLDKAGEGRAPALRVQAPAGGVRPHAAGENMRLRREPTRAVGDKIDASGAGFKQFAEGAGVARTGSPVRGISRGIWGYEVGLDRRSASGISWYRLAQVRHARHLSKPQPALRALRGGPGKEGKKDRWPPPSVPGRSTYSGRHPSPLRPM